MSHGIRADQCPLSESYSAVLDATSDTSGWARVGMGHPLIDDWRCWPYCVRRRRVQWSDAEVRNVRSRWT